MDISNKSPVGVYQQVMDASREIVDMKTVLEKRIENGNPIVLLLPTDLSKISQHEMDALKVLVKRFAADV